MNTYNNKSIPTQRLLAVPALLGVAFYMMSAPALAQSSVNLYGGISLALTKATGTSTALNTTGFGNYIGFKGSEDLGGGLSAYFDMRSNFKSDTGAMAGTVLWDEKTFVGLKGNFGSVQVGRFLNAYDDISFKAFGDTVASERGLAYSGMDDNTIGYYSPVFSGFSFAATTSLKEGNPLNGKVSAFNVKYANGPIVAALAHESASNKPNTMHNSTLVGGSYDFGVAKLLADYAKASNVTVIVGGKGAGINESNLRMGVSVPVGAGAFKAAFTKARNSTFDRQVGIGYWYNLSKRTFLFADINSTRQITAPATTKTTTTSFDVGINHNF
jgi:predicted porin